MRSNSFRVSSHGGVVGRMSNPFSPLKMNLSEYKSDIYMDTLLADMDLDNSKKFTSLCNYVIDNYSHKFTSSFYTNPIPDSPYENVLSYILPFLRRIYGNFFINLPKILTIGTHPSSDPVDKGIYGERNKKRIEYFQLKFDIDEIISFFIEKIEKNINILNDFKYIDIYPTLLGLITDEYVAKKLKDVSSVSESEMILSIQRDNKINIIENE